MASAKEVEERFDEFMGKAQQEPVPVEEAGREHVVMMNHQRFKRLRALEDQCWAMAAAEAEKSGYLGPEGTMKLLTRPTAE